MGRNTESKGNKMQRVRETLEHSVLNEMSSSDTSSHTSGTHQKKDTETLKKQGRMDNTKESSLVNITGPKNTRIHRYWLQAEYI